MRLMCSLLDTYSSTSSRGYSVTYSSPVYMFVSIRVIPTTS